MAKVRAVKIIRAEDRPMRLLLVIQDGRRLKRVGRQVPKGTPISTLMADVVREEPT